MRVVTFGLFSLMLGFFALVTAPATFAQTSVYEVSPWADAGVILSSSLASLFPAINAEHLIHPRCPCDPGEVNGLDRHVIGNASQAADVLSDVTVGMAVLVPPLLDYLDLGAREELAEDLVVYAETLSVSGAFVTLAKYTVQRPLPRVYAGQAPELLHEPGGYRAFYSGHADLTFSALSAASMTVNLRHHWGVWPWLVTGAIGISVAAERVAAGRHFYTDVGMGALAGTLFGVTIPLLHEAGSRAMGSKDEAIWVAPVVDGAQVSWSHHF